MAKQAAEKKPKIYWSSCKRFPAAMKHIKVSLDGEKDTATCKICKTTVEIVQPNRTKTGVILEIARVHFYKHKIGAQFAHHFK